MSDVARRERRVHFPEVVATSGPLEWKLAAHGGLFRWQNNIILEAFSILYAVRFAESNYPPGRLLVLF